MYYKLVKFKHMEKKTTGWAKIPRRLSNHIKNLVMVFIMKYHIHLTGRNSMNYSVSFYIITYTTKKFCFGNLYKMTLFFATCTAYICINFSFSRSQERRESVGQAGRERWRDRKIHRER